MIFKISKFFYLYDFKPSFCRKDFLNSFQFEPSSCHKRQPKVNLILIKYQLTIPEVNLILIKYQ